MRRVAVVAALVVVSAALAAAFALGRNSRTANSYGMQRLVSDGAVSAVTRDRSLVNAWGMAASPTGPWWTSNEARNSSTLYSGAGRKQLLTVSVEGGPTGVVYYGGKGFRVAGSGKSDPARFIYACEDGMIRAWTPTVPSAWSTKAEVTSSGYGVYPTVFRPRSSICRQMLGIASRSVASRSQGSSLRKRSATS